MSHALTANCAPSWSEMPSGTASRLASGTTRKLCQVPFPSALPHSMLCEAHTQQLHNEADGKSFSCLFFKEPVAKAGMRCSLSEQLHDLGTLLRVVVVVLQSTPCSASKTPSSMTRSLCW